MAVAIITGLVVATALTLLAWMAMHAAWFCISPALEEPLARGS